MDPTQSKAAASTRRRAALSFIDQTWLRTVKEAGSRLGYGQICRRHLPLASAVIMSAIPRADRDHEAARPIPRRPPRWPGVLTQSNSFKLTGKMAAARPTANSIWRISWASAAPPG